jgi:serine/threonine protein kinase
MSQNVVQLLPNSQRSSAPALPHLDRHGIVARLGVGGIAEVFLGREEIRPGLYRPVVIKTLHAHHADEPLVIQMFVDEARVALRLEHPNIVRTEGIGLIDGRHAIIMELLNGQPLQKVMARLRDRSRAMPIELAVFLVMGVLDGLHYAHELKGRDGTPLNIVHRDVSPQNLFLTYAGGVKVLDFGIAKNELQEVKTRTGLLKGKVAYMAPEQALGDGLDRRADLFSLGIVLWEVLTGARLFKGTNEVATLNLALRGPIPKTTELRAEIPPELDDIVRAALSRDVRARFPSALAMRHALGRFLESTGVTVSSAALRSFMHELFLEEIHARERQLIDLETGVSSAPPSSGSPVTLATGTRQEDLQVTRVSGVNEVVDELTRRHRVVTRTLFGGMVGVGVAFAVLLFIVLARLEQLPHAGAPAPAAQHPPVASERALPAATGAARNVAVPLAAGVAEAPNAARLAAEPARVLASTSERTPAARGAQRKPEARNTERRARAAAPAERVSTAERANAAIAAAPEEFGFLSLDTSPWSLVRANGRVLGQTPLVKIRLAAGVHTLSLSNSELGIETSYQVTIQPGATTARRVGLE